MNCRIKTHPLFKITVIFNEWRYLTEPNFIYINVYIDIKNAIKDRMGCNGIYTDSNSHVGFK